MATKVTIQNGSFQDAAGTAIVGTLVLQLLQDAVVSGTGQVAPKAISIAVVAGQAAATAVWGNDNLSPAGTVYTARLFDTSGAPVWGPENWSLTGAGPIEINTLVPTTSGASYPSAILNTPTADQTITVNSLLPAASNTTQSLGSLSAPWRAVLRNATVSNLNGVRVVDGTRYTNIAAALADLPANGGVVVCPAGYRETLTATTVLGSSSSQVLLFLAADVILTCNITGGASAMFSIHDGSGIVGTLISALSSRAAGSLISLASTASITNVIETADNPQSNIILDTFEIDNVNAGACSGAFLNLLNLNDSCVIRNVKGSYFPNIGVHVSATTGGVKSVGPLIIENCFFDGVNKTSSRPLLIESDGTGAINGVHVISGFWINPGTNKGCIEINGNGGSTGTCRDILLSEVYTQAGSNTGIVGVKIADAAGVVVLGGELQVTNGGTGYTGITIASSGSNLTHSITVNNFRLNGITGNTRLSNTITSETIGDASGNIPTYVYGGSGGSQPASPVVFGGDTAAHFNGYMSAGTGTLNISGTSAYIMFPSQVAAQNFLVVNNAGSNYAAMRVYNSSSSSRLDIGFTAAAGTAATPAVTFKDDSSALFGGTVEVTSALTVDGATPTGTGTKLGIGNTSGFGNGTAGTAVTTTLIGTGSGPATPQTIKKYLEIDLGGTKFWVPLVQ